MSNKQNQSLSVMEDIKYFITSGDISDLSNLSDNNDNIECETSLANIQNDEPDDPDGSELFNEDDQPLSNYVKIASKQTNHELKAASSKQKHVFRWKKRNIEPPANITFNGTFSNPPGTDRIPMRCFLSFFLDFPID